jgi:hypothetical protein
MNFKAKVKELSLRKYELTEFFLNVGDEPELTCDYLNNFEDLIQTLLKTVKKLNLEQEVMLQEVVVECSTIRRDIRRFRREIYGIKKQFWEFLDQKAQGTDTFFFAKLDPSWLDMDVFDWIKGVALIKLAESDELAQLNLKENKMLLLSDKNWIAILNWGITLVNKLNDSEYVNQQFRKTKEQHQQLLIFNFVESFKNHITGANHFDVSEVQAFSAILPSFLFFKGLAYRAITCSKFDFTHENVSWSKEKENTLQALKSISHKGEVSIFQSDVYGLDTEKLSSWLKGMDFHTDAIEAFIRNEKEVLALEFGHVKFIEKRIL